MAWLAATACCDSPAVAAPHPAAAAEGPGQPRKERARPRGACRGTGRAVAAAGAAAVFHCTASATVRAQEVATPQHPPWVGRPWREGPGAHHGWRENWKKYRATTTEQVHTTLGTAVGAKFDDVEVFWGLPFAQAPVGALRWAPPAAPSPWGGVWDATYPRNKCPQPGFPNPSEDCLYLNIFRPDGTAKAGSPKPVIVWVHGGNWVVGSGSEELYDGTALARDHDVIVVTLNYRLGVFGFLASDELRSRDVARGSTGNYGLQDQRAALQWIRNHIGSFGGNPVQVLLAGQSAGAGMVSAHIVTPASWHLFSSAMMMSGGFAPWTVKRMDDKRHGSTADAWGQVSACGGCDSAPDVVGCLANLTVDTLVQCTPRDAFWEGSFCTTIDGVELSAHPWQLAQDGQVAPGIRVLIGSVGDESGLQLSPSTNVEDHARLLGSFVNRRVDLSKELMGKYQPYIPAEEEHNTPYSGYYWAGKRVDTEGSVQCAARDSARAMAHAGHEVYWYEFDWVAEHAPPGSAAWLGADIPFLFRVTRNVNSFVYPNVQPIRGSNATVIMDVLSGAAVRLASGLAMESPWQAAFAPSYCRATCDTQPGDILRIGRKHVWVEGDDMQERCELWHQVRMAVPYPPECTWTWCAYGWPVSALVDDDVFIQKLLGDPWMSPLGWAMAFGAFALTMSLAACWSHQLHLYRYVPWSRKQPWVFEPLDFSDRRVANLQPTLLSPSFSELWSPQSSVGLTIEDSDGCPYNLHSPRSAGDCCEEKAVV